MTAMLDLAGGQMHVIEPEKVKNRKGYTNSGHLVAEGAYIEKRPTFTQVQHLPGVFMFSQCMCLLVLIRFLTYWMLSVLYCSS